jgi:hypothetical protein
MQGPLTILLYVAAGALLIVLALGIFNLARTDEKRASRSNVLMRWRIAIQAVCILLLVALGFAAGAINF